MKWSVCCVSAQQFLILENFRTSWKGGSPSIWSENLSFLIVYIRLIVLSVLHIILFASLSPTTPPRLPFLSIVPSSQGGVSSGLLWAPSTCKKWWSGMFTFQTTFQLSCALVPLIFNLQTKIWITSSVNRMCVPHTATFEEQFRKI